MEPQSCNFVVEEEGGQEWLWLTPTPKASDEEQSCSVEITAAKLFPLQYYD